MSVIECVYVCVCLCDFAVPLILAQKRRRLWVLPIDSVDLYPVEREKSVCIVLVLCMVCAYCCCCCCREPSVFRQRENVCGMDIYFFVFFNYYYCCAAVPYPFFSTDYVGGVEVCLGMI